MFLFNAFVFLCCLSLIVAQQCNISPNVARVDCYPQDGASQSGCESRQCCWRAPTVSSNLTDVNVPYCYFPSDFPTYQVVSNQSTDVGYRLRIVKSQKTYLPNEILDLTVDLIYETQQRLRIRIYDSNAKRFEVPIDVPTVTSKASTTDYDVQVQAKPFAILVRRISTGTIL